MIIVLSLLFVAPSIYSGFLVSGKSVDDDTPIIDYIRGVKVDFEPPKIILDCGCYFLLNVTISRTKSVMRPRYFSISVFLKTEDKYGIIKIIPIGSIASVFLPITEDEVKISIPCFTNNKMLQYLYDLYFGKKYEFELSKGSIGVRIESFSCRYLLEAVLSKMKLWLNEAVIWRVHRWFISGFPTNRPPENVYRLLSRIHRFSSILRNMDATIVWRDVNLSPPFVCSKKINFEYVNVSNKTDPNGKFKVSFKISNHLDEDIKIVMHIDLSEKSFINLLFPVAKEMTYNAGIFLEKIPANEYIIRTVNCSFPEQIFNRKNYSVSVECAPYIPIGRTNKFGILFFDIRWMIFVKPRYVASGYIENSARKLWYNLPIFWGDPQKAAIFPVHYDSISYKGKIPSEEIDRTVKQLGKEVKSWIILYFFLTLLLIGFFCIGYWIVRRHKSSQYS